MQARLAALVDDGVQTVSFSEPFSPDLSLTFFLFILIFKLLATYYTFLTQLNTEARPIVANLRNNEFPIQQWTIPVNLNDLDESIGKILARKIPKKDDKNYYLVIALNEIDLLRVQLIHHIKNLERNPVYAPAPIELN